MWFLLLSFFWPFAQTNKDLDYHRALEEMRSVPVVRDYSHLPTLEDQQDIAFIVHSLGQKPLAKIYFSKQTITEAGARIDYLHPLRFLEAIFTNEELKVSMRMMRERGWIWPEFVGGLSTTFNQEKSQSNLKQEYVADFAQSVDLSFDRLYPFFQREAWVELMQYLVKEVPRKGDFNRYDM